MVANQPSESADESGNRTEQETYEAVTWFEANNAETQAILLGRHDEGDVFAEPEVHDKQPVRARRHFEPVEIIDLPREMGREDAIDWLEANRDHPGFDGFDWEEHDRKELLSVIVENRNNFRSTLSHFERRIAEVHPASIEAQNELEEIQEEMVEAMTGGTPVEVNCVQKQEAVSDD